MTNTSKTCPSSRFTKGAYLLGIKNEKEQIDLLENPVKITEEIYTQVQETYSKPEKALRIANKCIQSGCKQWTGTKCGVIDNILEKVEAQYINEQLPECAIRDTCRWFSQEAAAACKVCTLVTTHVEHPKEDKFLRF